MRKYKINGKKFKLHFMDQEIEPGVTDCIEFPSNEKDKIMKKSNWSWLMNSKNSTSRLVAEFRRQNVMPSHQKEKQSKLSIVTRKKNLALMISTKR